MQLLKLLLLPIECAVLLLIAVLIAPFQTIKAIVRLNKEEDKPVSTEEEYCIYCTKY